MKIIRNIQINYFRSLYSAHIGGASDLSLIFGRNDSGKSNILRALNLFFNDETDANSEIEFALDFSDIRRGQARSAKGRQFIWIRVDFNVPRAFQKSLGRTVSLKRQWNIYGEMTETRPKGLSGGQSAQLSKFINQIDYTYIPAIKDRGTYEALIERLYNAVGTKRGFDSATKDFISSIRNETLDLSNALSLSLNQRASLAAPSDMGALYRSLDFALGEESHSLMKQKGDGVKVRHLPSFLRFINENEPYKYFIWGFEEPENSLDIANAQSEASSFMEIASRGDTQIFLTSHSPVFYLLGGGSDQASCNRYFVSKQQIEEDSVRPENAVQDMGNSDAADAIMGAASLLQLPYIARHIAELQSEVDSAKSEVSEFNEKIEAMNSPTLFVEGNNDLHLFRALQEREELWGFSIESLGGTPSTAGEILARLHKGVGVPEKIFLLFDNDFSGRKSMNALSKGGGDYQEPKSVNDSILVQCLPIRDDFLDFKSRYDLRDEQVVYEAEFLIEGAVGAQILTDLLKEVGEELLPPGQIHDNYHKGLSQAKAYDLRTSEVGTVDWFWSRTVPDKLKSEYGKRALDCDVTFTSELLKKIASVLTN